ncbi:MAG: hypothetical protein ACRDHX_05050, partial [Chloroflexota bacterium]
VLIMEDLGQHPTLADLLLGGDREAAEDGLLEWAAALGRLNALTLVRAAELAAQRAQFPRSPYRPQAAWAFNAGVHYFGQLAESLAVRLPAGLESELATIRQFVETDLQAFSPCDVCPDNNFLTPDGVRFFDLEFADFHNALLDGAYLSILFPTCWCVGSLPPGARTRTEAAYREALVVGEPRVADNEYFASAMAMACAAWVIVTLNWHHPPLKDADHFSSRPPQRWAISGRARLVHRAEVLAARCREWGQLPAVTEVVDGMAGAWRVTWSPSESELPLYPAFS